MALRSRVPNVLRLVGIRYMSGEWGSGSGKGGGTGGSVRDAGGSFGKMEAAHEELYFRKLEKEQLEKLRRHLQEEVEYHEEQIEEHKQELQLRRLKEHLQEEVNHHEKSIRDHEEAIDRHKKKIKKLQQDELHSSEDHKK